MRGAVAAGHPLTAEAGAEVLAEGGNAVDACIAAAFVSWVTESTLTGPGAGGFMLVHRARDRSTRLLDHFVTVPGIGLPRGEAALPDRAGLLRGAGGGGRAGGGTSPLRHLALERAAGTGNRARPQRRRAE